MDLKAFIKSKIPSHTPSVTLLDPANRSFLLFLSVIGFVVVGWIVYATFSTSSEQVVQSINTTGKTLKKAEITTSSVVSEEYAQDIQTVNKKSYEDSLNKAEGSSLPTLYNVPDTGDDVIEACGCSFDEAAKESLIKEILARGSGRIGNSDAMRVGMSDIYIRPSSLLVDDLNKPYLYNGKKISTDDTGALIFTKNGLSVLSLNDTPTHLSNAGVLFDKTTTKLIMAGKLLSSSGIIVLGNGIKASRPGMMTQIGASDTYLTNELQLATMDGKPVMHSGKFVFKGSNEKLHNAYNENVVWNDKPVLQSEDGTLTDRNNKKFEKLGVLFSYDSILIDNDSMLTQKINDAQRFGTSDIYVNKSNELIDRYLNDITHRDYHVKNGLNQELFTQLGALRNNIGERVSIEDNGRLKAVKGIVLTGTIKSGLNVPYDKYGHLITRKGKLTQLGDSDVYVTNDRFISTGRGLALQKSGKDTFQDINRFKVINELDAYGLKNHDGAIIRDILKKEVYLNAIGQFVYIDGQLVSQTGLFAEDGGVLIDSEGILLSKQRVKQLITDKDGNKVSYNNMDVYANAEGQLFDENGDPVLDASEQAVFLKDGVLINASGDVLSEGILFSGSRVVAKGEAFNVSEPLLGPGGKPLFVNGVEAFVRADGLLVDKNGNLIIGDDGEPLFLNEDNKITNSKGKVQDINFANANGTIIRDIKRGTPVIKSARGNEILYNGKPVSIVDGFLVDSEGNLILDENDNPVTMNEQGKFVDDNGKIVTVDGLTVTGESSDLSDGLLTKKILLDENGNPETLNGRKIMINEDDSLSYLDGSPVLDASGNRVFKVGDDFTNSTGGSIDFQTDDNSVFKDLEVVTGADGSVLTHNGKKVFKRADGSLVDEDGNVILGVDGKPLYMNDNNEIIGGDGELADMKDFTIDGEPAKNAGLLTSRVKDGDLPSSLLGIEAITGPDGSSLMHNGKKVFKRADGTLVDEFGNHVIGKDGKPLTMNENGDIINSDGSVADMNKFTINGEPAKGVALTAKAIDISDLPAALKPSLIKALTSPDGSPLMHNGKKVFKRADGTIVDEDGNVILGDDGKPLTINENGGIVNSDGSKADMDKFTINGQSAKGVVLIQEAVSQADLPRGLQNKIFEAVLGKDGTPLMHNGKRVFKREDGVLADKFGTPILSADGKPLMLNENNEIVLAEKSELTGPDGSPLMIDGKKVFKRADGTIVDEDGNIVLGKGGKPLTMNSEGALVNSDGTQADMNKFTINGESAEGVKLTANTVDINGLPVALNSGLFKALTGPDGSPLMIDGKKVFKRADGTIVDEDGNIVLGKGGKPLTMNSEGALVNSDGTQADMNKFTINGESAEGVELSLVESGLSGFSVNGNKVSGSDLQKIESSKFPTIGDTGIRITDDGLLIDKEGKVITHNGRAVRKGKDGKLYYDDGSPVLDDLGRQVFINQNGKLHDGKGNDVTGVTLLNGDNQLVGGSELEAKKIGDSDLFVNKRNNLVDASNKPFIHKGKPIMVKNGKLVTDDNKAVVDVKGNPISITRSGALIDRSRLPAKGAFVTDTNGVVIDNKGRYVNSGGKMTAISDGGPFVTESGLLVDKDGKAILINGKQVYVDKQGRLNAHNGRAIRYKGRKLHLDKRGNVLDENEDVLTFEGETVTLTNDGLTGSDGEAISTVATKETSKAFQQTIENLLNKDKDDTSNDTKTPKSSIQEQLDKPRDKDISAEDKEDELSRVQILEVNERYQKRKNYLLQKVNSYKGIFTAKSEASSAELGGNEYIAGVDAEYAANHIVAELEKGDPDTVVYEKGDVRHKAGTMLYAVNTYRVNTDLNSKLVFNLFGVERDSKLYKGTAHGTVELVYDYIVVNFTKVCPVGGECFPIEGVGVDPGTSEAAIEGDIDKHFWYRFGGLSLATLFQGAADAVSSSRSRTEQVDEYGKTVTYSGLDNDKLIISSTGILAETLGAIFTENVTRPYTGIIEKDEEIGIFLMEDLIIKK